METKVTLISWTKDPVKTLTAIWASSRNNDPVDLSQEDPNLLKTTLENHIPVTEMIDFIFHIEGMSIALREQMVRHRVGVKFGPRVGVDIAPDLPDSSFWLQSMRYLDMSTFFDDGLYERPESVHGNVSREMIYDDHMEQTQCAYQRLIASGVPAEEARLILPLGVQHRGVWKLNLSSLLHVIGHRSCWIAQLGVWKPVVFGMISELVSKVDPIFSQLANPPCIKKGTFDSCPYQHFNRERVEGTDPLPPCPLYLNYHCDGPVTNPLETASDAGTGKTEPMWYRDEEGDWVSKSPIRKARFDKMSQQYQELWQRDVRTGEPIQS